MHVSSSVTLYIPSSGDNRQWPLVHPAGEKGAPRARVSLSARRPSLPHPPPRTPGASRLPASSPAPLPGPEVAAAVASRRPTGSEKLPGADARTSWSERARGGARRPDPPPRCKRALRPSSAVPGAGRQVPGRRPRREAAGTPSAGEAEPSREPRRSVASVGGWGPARRIRTARTRRRRNVGRGGSARAAPPPCGSAWGKRGVAQAAGKTRKIGVAKDT
ncbi:probable G-protein coupled receptor 160 isoform X4 [Equus asinus]|nr:probable G-protein coupled receptor 160 isoform X4 [Equus asinus]XP_044627004.1 probable G-protein coupled receptor 160 isoform X4 [Equus asinus]